MSQLSQLLIDRKYISRLQHIVSLTTFLYSMLPSARCCQRWPCRLYGAGSRFTYDRLWTRWWWTSATIPRTARSKRGRRLSEALCFFAVGRLLGHCTRVTLDRCQARGFCVRAPELSVGCTSCAAGAAEEQRRNVKVWTPRVRFYPYLSLICFGFGISRLSDR